MKTTKPGWYQVVLDPDHQENQLLFEEVMRQVESAGTPKYTFWMGLKVAVSRVLHPFRLHHFVRMKEFDLASRRIIETPFMVCMWCTKVRKS